ncbi:MAG: 3'(2'),5'-bisphosphate nucleotidase CysQ [Rhodobacteraceae bacterium]|nr:3'(2'),5'-bisphosphate nucleotidase CysQ [Paracoccaceae bacterium]
MPESDLALLTRAARAAGEIALRYWKHDPVQWEKPDGAGPVTEADMAVDAMLAELLCTARPDYGWLSEETDDDPARLARPRVFIVDPIDGTRAFIAGEAGFALSLAVAENGIVTAAVVYLPALDLLYTAEAGGPALLNGAPIRVATPPANGANVLTSGGALNPDHWPGGVPDLHRAFRTSLAWRLCLVAEGNHDGLITLRDAWEWDIAAGGLIATAAGATVTDRFGAPLRFNAAHPQAAGVLAAPAALHADWMTRLSPR